MSQHCRYYYHIGFPLFRNLIIVKILLDDPSYPEVLSGPNIIVLSIFAILWQTFFAMKYWYDEAL